MNRRDIINRIAWLEGSRDYWLHDRPEMNPTDWANLCEEDADELRALRAQLGESPEPLPPTRPLTDTERAVLRGMLP